MTADEVEKINKRVTAVLGLIITGFVFIVVAHILRDWMLWTTGAGIIRFAMWLGED